MATLGRPVSPKTRTIERLMDSQARLDRLAVLVERRRDRRLLEIVGACRDDLRHVTALVDRTTTAAA